jgi:hypothetical protein
MERRGDGGNKTKKCQLSLTDEMASVNGKNGDSQKNFLKSVTGSHLAVQQSWMNFINCRFHL